MKDYLKDIGKYTIGPVLAVGLLFAALRFNGPITVFTPSPTVTVPNLPVVDNPPAKPVLPPAKIIRSFITKNDEAISPELEEKLNKVLETGESGEYHYIGYPETGKLRRKRIIIQDMDAPVIVEPQVPNNPNLPNTPPPSTPPPVSPGVRVTYVHEKDQNAVSSQVQAGLYKLTEKGVTLASSFDKDTKNGRGETPALYKLALEEAMRVGLPALIVEKDGKILNVVKDPKTVEDVFNSVK